MILKRAGSSYQRRTPTTPSNSGAWPKKIDGSANRYAGSKTMAQRFGMLCFSTQWHNPVLESLFRKASRYLLGFEVDDKGLQPVNYVTERTPISFPPTLELTKQLL